ncbi:MAG: glycosyltransferase [Gemmatimonadales bacterium]
MRIVAHNGARIWGGAERATVLLLEGLSKRGHEVTLLCNSELVASEARRKGIAASICVLGGDIAIPDSFRLASVLRTLRPDAFIVGTYKKLFLAGLGARLARVPRVIARVGLETDTPRSIKYRFALRRWIDGVVVNARRIVEPFARLRGFGRDRVALIHNGVSSAMHATPDGDLRRDLGLTQADFVIGTVARLAKQKRIDRLVRIVSLLPADVHCVIAGDGPRQSDVTRLAAELGVASRVHFLGHRDDTASVLETLDLFIVTSDSEGLSNAMLEAMSFGLPIVGTPVSGSEDALGGIGDEPAAGVIAGFSPETLAAEIMSLRDDPERRAFLGKAAKSRAIRDFSLDTMLDRWEAFLAPAPR